MATFKELLAQAKTPEEKQAVERAFNRNRGRVNDLTTAKALGAVGGPKIGGGGSYTFKSGDNLFDVAQSIYGSDRYVEQLVAANPWLRSSNGNILANVPVGSTLKLPVLRTGVAGADIRVSNQFMAGLGVAPSTPAAVEPDVKPPATLANQPQANNPNYGGTTLPLQSAGQPLVGDTVRPGAGSNRVMQTGSAAPGITAPQGFSSPSQLQATQYGGMPAPPPVNNPLSTGGTPSTTKPQQAPQRAWAGNTSYSPSALANFQTTPELDSVYGFNSGANSAQFGLTSTATFAWSLYEKAGSYEQWISALNAAGLAEAPPETTQGTIGDASGELFTPYQAGVYVGTDERALRQAARRREQASGRNRLPRNYAPSPFTNNPAFNSNGMIDRALNWRIGF